MRSKDPLDLENQDYDLEKLAQSFCQKKEAKSRKSEGLRTKKETP